VVDSRETSWPGPGDACHRLGGRLDERHVGLAVATERRGHGDEDRVRLGQLRLVRGEPGAVVERGLQLVVADVLDVARAGVEQVDLLLQTSNPMTSRPRLEAVDASGRPTYPRPMTPAVQRSSRK
jgi:hypothetical protein